MHAVGYILYLTGLIACFIGNLKFLAVVFRYSTAWFFACLWIPFAPLVYFFLYVKQTWKPMIIGAAGFVVALFGLWLAATFTG